MREFLIMKVLAKVTEKTINKRDREKTHTRIRKAIVRIEKGRPKTISPERKMSVAAVAAEAEVSTTLIHNQYPDLKARIQGNQDKGFQLQRDDIRRRFQQEKEKTKEYRKQIEKLKQTNAVLASKLATCLVEINQIHAGIDSKNITVLNRR